MVQQKDITGVPGLLDISVRADNAPSENRTNVWHMFEDRKPNIPYVLTADCAEGSIDPDAAQDSNCALIARPNEEDESLPVIVAAIRSTLPVLPFARTCSHAMRYYNNALLASERGRGKDNEAFGQELDDWPWWFYFSVTNDKTGKVVQKKGFDTNARSRDIIFELIRDYIDDRSEDIDPELKDDSLVRELAAAVIGKSVGGKSRCDHPPSGTLDMAIAFGIMLYVLSKTPDQISCNAYETPVESGLMRFLARQNEQKPYVFMGQGLSTGR
jgi:hypothetical protein